MWCGKKVMDKLDSMARVRIRLHHLPRKMGANAMQPGAWYYTGQASLADT